MAGIPKKSSRTRKRARLEQLEPRTLYSADPLSAGIVVVDAEPRHDDLTNEAFYKESSLADEAIEASTDQRQTRLELIFIDEATPDRDLLINDLLANSSSERVFQVITIAQNQNGIQVISDTLAGLTDVSDESWKTSNNQSLTLYF